MHPLLVLNKHSILKNFIFFLFLALKLSRKPSVSTSAEGIYLFFLQFNNLSKRSLQQRSGFIFYPAIFFVNVQSLFRSLRRRPFLQLLLLPHQRTNYFYLEMVFNWILTIALHLMWLLISELRKTLYLMSMLLLPLTLDRMF